jgi:hypothetical protein
MIKDVILHVSSRKRELLPIPILIKKVGRRTGKGQ